MPLDPDRYSWVAPFPVEGPQPVVRQASFITVEIDALTSGFESRAVDADLDPDSRPVKSGSPTGSRA